MTSNLSNENINIFLLKRVVKEFKNFLVGTKSNVSFDLGGSFKIPFQSGIDLTQKEIVESELTDFTDMFDFHGIKKIDIDYDLESVRDDYIYDMLDNTYAAFFIKDIIKGNAFKNKNTVDKSNYFLIVHEPGHSSDSKYYINNFSTKELVSGLKREDLKKLPDTSKSDSSKITKNKKGKNVPVNIQYTTVNNASKEINNDLNNNCKNYPNRLNPSLSAIVLKKHGLGIGARNSEHLNIFFNGISTLEMSRCVPYIDIAIVSRSEEKKLKNINNVSFMRFIKRDKENNFILDENLGLKNAKNINFDKVFGTNEYSLDSDYDISFMDIFTSTQTMANANINKNNGSSPGYLNSNILEPITPFLSLKNLSIDISGMGAALYSSKVGSINMVLHDRSRLSDIASLISPANFGTTKMIIEFGWHHPEGGIENNNLIGQYLNSLRDRSIYTVKTSNFNFSNGNAVNISLSLACFGKQQSKSISAAAGYQVPVNIFREGIKKIVQDITKKKASGQPQTKIKEVRNTMKIELRNSLSNLRMIDFSDYRDLVLSYQKYRTFNNNTTKIEVEKKLKKISGIREDIEKNEESQNDTDINKKNILQLMYSKLYGLRYSNKSKSNFDDRFKTSFSNKNKNTLESVSSNESINNDRNVSEEFVPLGKVFMSFIGHSLAMSGMFDEVQMVFYPLNIHSGGARVHTTASMPIEYSLLNSAITKQLQNNPNISVQGFFNLIESKILRDQSLSIYNINSTVKKYNEAIEAEKKKIKKEQEKIKNEREPIEIEIETLIRDAQTEIADLAESSLTEDEINDKIETINKDISKEKIRLEGEFNNNINVQNSNKSIKEFRENITTERSKQKTDLENHLAKVYKNDGGPGLSEAKFIRPNFSLYMEVLTRRDPNKSLDVSAYDIASIVNGSAFDSFLRQNGVKDISNMLEGSSGKERSICRIHIYDENTSLDPKKQLIQTIATEGITSGVIKQGTDKIHTSEEVMKALGLNSVEKIKNYVKSSYPSITYGANNSTINNISITSNVSDQLSQTIQISSFSKRNNPLSPVSNVNNIEEITVVPATISVKMMGNPFIGRGNEIYIDFGTGTTLDNVYTVKSVSHNISNGVFETSVDLIFSGQGDTRSIVGGILSSINAKK